MTGPASIPVLSAARFDGAYVPTCLSNGVVGITPGANPLLQGKVLVSGFVHSQGGAELPGFTTGPFAVAAAFLGDRWKAAELFTTAWKPFWIEPFGMTRECAAHSYGGFVTNNGSLLQTVLLGFTGLRIGEGLEARYPASMPEGWEQIKVERIWNRGIAKRLVADHGRRALLTEP